jgi:hypothetical protein
VDKIMPQNQPDGIKMADKAIADSKKALASAVKFNGPVKPMPKPAAPTKPAAPSSGLLTATGHDQAPALKAKTDQIDAYNAVTNAAPKMHKGGEVMEDGIKNLKKGEVVIPKEKAEEGKKIMGLKEKAKGPMAKALEEEDNEPKAKKSESKEKESKKEDKKEGKKDGEKKAKKHNYHRAEHEFHSNGSITTKLHHKPKPSVDGKVEPTPEPTSFASPDFASMQSAMQEHVGGGPEGAESSEGEASAAAPAAEAAPAQA